MFGLASSYTLRHGPWSCGLLYSFLATVTVLFSGLCLAFLFSQTEYRTLVSHNSILLFPSFQSIYIQIARVSFHFVVMKVSFSYIWFPLSSSKQRLQSERWRSATDRFITPNRHFPRIKSFKKRNCLPNATRDDNSTSQHSPSLVFFLRPLHSSPLSSSPLPPSWPFRPPSSLPPSTLSLLWPRTTRRPSSSAQRSSSASLRPCRLPRTTPPSARCSTPRSQKNTTTPPSPRGAA